MNGEYEIDKDTFMGLDTSKQNWMMYQTFNKYRVDCNERFSESENRLEKLENRKRFDTAVSGSAGVVGGFIAMGSMLVARAVGWFK